MRTMSFVIIGSGSYEEQRKARKLGYYSAALFFFKSMFGVGIFAIPVGFSKVGYILGIMISILSCYIIGNGMYRLMILTEKIEAEKNIKI